MANSDSVGPERLRNQALGLTPALSLPPRGRWLQDALGRVGSISIALGSCCQYTVRKGRGHNIVSTISALPSAALLSALLPEHGKSADGPWEEVWKAERARPF